jgi:hypothetical protein
MYHFLKIKDYNFFLLYNSNNIVVKKKLTTYIDNILTSFYVTSYTNFYNQNLPPIIIHHTFKDSSIEPYTNLD